MGHQVNFFVMPADLPDLATAIRITGDVCFLADASQTCEPLEPHQEEAHSPPRIRTAVGLLRSRRPAVDAEQRSHHDPKRHRVGNRRQRLTGRQFVCTGIQGLGTHWPNCDHGPGLRCDPQNRQVRRAAQ